MEHTKKKRRIARSRAGSLIAAWTLMVAVVLTASCFLFPSRAYALTLPAEDSEGGSCWKIDADGNLTISFDYDCGYQSYSDLVTSVTFGENVTEIPYQCLQDFTSLKSVTVLGDLTSIGGNAFSGCTSLETVELKGTSVWLGYDLFYNCTALTSVTMPESVSGISSYGGIFNGCSSLTTVNLPSGMDTIPDYMFEGCSSLTSITIPDSVTTIGKQAFKGCGRLASVTIPEGVTSIGQYAFLDCTSLSSVTIPKSVTSIGYGAFNGCNSLAEVHVLAETPPTIASNSLVFQGTVFCQNFEKKIYVPKGTVQAYKTAWTDWANYIYDVENYKLGVDPTAADYADVDIEVQGHTKEDIVYSVDVEWGAMTFRYENSSWDATAHKVKGGAKWQVYDSVANKALDSTTDAINRIQVTNHSNAPVKAAISCEFNSEYPDMRGNFSTADGDTETDFRNDKIYLESADNGGEGKGTPTVGTVYFMPDNYGMSELLHGTDGSGGIGDIDKWTQIGTIKVAILTTD